jgi:hypothetical protein
MLSIADRAAFSRPELMLSDSVGPIASLEMVLCETIPWHSLIYGIDSAPDLCTRKAFFSVP